MNEISVFHGMSQTRLSQLLEAIRGVKAVLVGDICLDIYWNADMTKSELSRETPHFPLPIVDERLSPGAGGNVAANMLALCPRDLTVVSIVGDDWRGRELRDILLHAGARADGILSAPELKTPAYCKPFRKGISDVEYEDPRLDFINFTSLTVQTEQRLIALLREAAQGADVIAVSDQFGNGCVTPTVRAAIEQLAQEGKKVIVDSRDRIALYHTCILKPNEVEALRACDLPIQGDFESFVGAAEQLSNRQPVCMTIGALGSLWAEGGKATHIPGIPVQPPLDIVGAGDAFLSSFSLALAAGASAPEAAHLGNLAASITVRKLKTTGTATADEILARNSSL